ncbi:signal transduction histidine kinase [Lacibacter cauensis]|uniref:histidine kinase n=1 Tax=Lacibacter cauensis TaxID=510947 RepID=A0A562SG68_9BACT|nr:two-component regulator propeller domain-containing protein [Lacibacter cauensis]TWI80321.1 signal transduction histidine kinase [Lacibacter cauensis]
MKRNILFSFYCVVLSIFLLTGITANAVPPVKRLGIESGLSNNSVRVVYQDKRGFIWMGTYDGLNYYDGKEFKVFRNKLNDSTSIPHNYIYSLHEDVNHNLWVGTGQGVVKYNSTYENFSPLYGYLLRAKQPVKVTINATGIQSSVTGTLFFATNGWGLLVKQPNDEYAREVPLLSGNSKQGSYNARVVAVDNTSKKVWVFVAGKGLCLYNEQQGNITLVNSEVKVANCMLLNKSGELWIGGEAGLYLYDPATNRYSKHYTEHAGELSGQEVMTLCFDKQQNLWIGTEGGAISILDNATGAFAYINSGQEKDQVSSEAVYSIIRDTENRMWIGTIKGGCNVFDEQKNNFLTVTSDPYKTNTLSSNFIYSFFEDKDGDILIGTEGGGVSVWNRSLNTFKNYRYQSGNISSISHNIVSSILQDYTGALWMATYGGGINRFKKSSGSFERFRCINDATGEENRNAWLLYEDKAKTLWATTFINGPLYFFDRSLNKFVVFDQRVNDLVSLLEDSKGQLWGGNTISLIRIDRKNNQHQFYNLGKPVRAIFEDSKKNLWIGLEGGGLVLFDGHKGSIKKRYSSADGLCNNAVLNIEEDAKGFLWLSTFNGLSRFDQATSTFKNFYESDGLQSNQFSYNASYKLRSGELLFGGINGFNVFVPEKITQRTFTPPLYITSILINNKSVSEVSDYIKEAKGSGISELRVPFKEAVLSFEFTALEYTSPEKISYAYYLDGWDKNWNYTGNIRNINYNNIKEGSYKLRIRSTNANGDWNTQETVLAITILPPWYRTIFAYLLYLVAAGSLVYMFYRYRLQQTRLTYKVKLAELNAEKEKEINEKRQSFFTNITHEFRTPLTLIINPVNDLLKQEEKTEAKEELNVVYRNARRLLSLVDQLLLFRKTESETGKLRISSFNFYDLSHDVYLYFKQQAKVRHIDYTFICSNQSLAFFGDKTQLEIVFYNLLSNAFKYTPDHGKISFSITDDGTSIYTQVTDSGQGVPEHIGDRIFEKFYQVKEENVPVKPGFGIGLYLVKQLVEEHKGKISYKSKEGGGTSFMVQLKKGKAHFGNVVIQEAAAKNENLLLTEIDAGIEPIPVAAKQTTDGLESVVSEKPSILVTDDNVQLRNYLVQVFRTDFIVHEAGSAEEGLKLAKELQPDVIISDLVMEAMTGLDFCKAVKESQVLGHIPFILITGTDSPESKLKGIEYGADDYITKPFEKDMLVARVQSLLKKQENLQKYFYNEITHQQNSLNISGEYKEFLEACIAVVERNLDRDDFNIQVLATEMGMSHSKLYKKIKTISGQSANAFIRFIRLRKAAELFINSDYNINETAFYVGIKDIKYFREQFAKTFGMKPSEYIEKYRKNLGKNYKLNEKVKK